MLTLFTCCLRELQMLQYEITRKHLLEKQQKKIEALEARAAELKKQKVEHEKAWAAAQRERELQKVRRSCLRQTMHWHRAAAPA